MNWRTAAISIALLLFSPAALDAEEDDPLARAREHFRTGAYGDAEDVLEKALAKAPGDPRLCALRAEVLLEVGRFEEAGGAAEAGGDDARCLTLAGESLRLRGRYEESEKALRRAISKVPDLERARYQLGLLHLDRAERTEAREVFDWFFDHYAKKEIEDPEALVLVALASVRAAELDPEVEMDFEVTKDLLGHVVKEHPDHLPAQVALGDLYLAAYHDQYARKWFRKALTKNRRYPPAQLGLAGFYALHYGEHEGVKRCQEALQTNPSSFEAKEYIARVRIGDSQHDEAAKLLGEILATNPKRKRARGLLAAIDYLAGDRKGFDAKVAELLAEDPRYSEVYVDLAGILEEHRRFEEAEAFTAKACETDAEDFRAWWARGRNLVHLAREKEAREALKKAKYLDPFGHYGHPTRENMVEVLGHLEEFVESKSEHFVYRIHGGENAVLSRYYHRFMERSWDVLTEQYGFEPEGPILTEVFHRHDDFAVRTIGLPGIGALGACFGKVITLDSPSARKPGEFTWASTAHHEFAHVITLQLSKGRVPRWFTEGLSVYAERQFADWWERDMDRRLFDAYANDEIFGVMEFNSKFRGGDVLFAYYLGGMMCEFLVDEFGFPKIPEMLKAYGRDQMTPKVLDEVLDVTPVEYDRRFREWVGRYVGGWKLTPRWSDDTLKASLSKLSDHPEDLDALATVAWAHFQRGNTVDAMSALGKALKLSGDDPSVLLLRGEVSYRSGRFDQAKHWYGKYLATGGDDLALRLHLADVLEKERDYEGAMAQYVASKACFPLYAGEGNAYLELARLKKGEGDLDGAMAEIEEYVRLANTGIERRLELADWYEERGEWGKLARVLTEVVEIYPLGEKSAEPVHARLAEALVRLSDLTGAALEYEVALELGVSRAEEPRHRVALGEVYYLLGRLGDARHQARAALEIDPESKAAKELLDKVAER